MKTVNVDFSNRIGRITANDATPAPPAPVSLTGRVLRWLRIPARHVRLTQVIFQDVTDLHNELVQEREWLLHPSERLALSGNLFAIENILTGEGWLIIKTLPLPHARPVFSPVDLFVERIEEGGFEARVVTSDGDEQSSDTTILSYGGGVPGRIRAIHAFQQSCRPDTACHRLPRFISNTWGDRNCDSRVCESFLMDEITAGSRLGVDIVQIDDGWQQGVTSTSIYAQERGGLSEGFHSDMGFWHVHSTRFPHGLEPVVSAAAAKGMDIGLWFSPDSSLSFANWEKDAAVLLDLHQRHGIKYFKIDGVNVKDRVGVTNLAHFFTRVMAVSAGKIVLDLDITAGIRPGYFGALSAGPLFVENRYTDWMNYWPHHTLRNLWSLAHWVDPRRLRMEWLNHARKAERYSGDPLAPAAYTPDTLFAMVMLSNPLGWFEVSSLPESYFAVAAQLVTKWREARERLFSGTILPVGDRPDGRVWTGFGSISNDGFACDLLVFRELNESPRHVFQIPGFVGADLNIRVIAGHGCGRSTPEGIAVEIPAPLGYLWVRATSRYSSHQKTSEENI